MSFTRAAEETWRWHYQPPPPVLINGVQNT